MAKRLRTVRVRDLRDQTGMTHRPFLVCRWCGDRCSAHAGDYFAAAPDTAFYHCGSSMMLAREVVTLEEVTG